LRGVCRGEIEDRKAITGDGSFAWEIASLRLTCGSGRDDAILNCHLNDRLLMTVY
jgi:hypothetical protein